MMTVTLDAAHSGGTKKEVAVVMAAAVVATEAREEDKVDPSRENSETNPMSKMMMLTVFQLKSARENLHLNGESGVSFLLPLYLAFAALSLSSIRCSREVSMR